jgi:hypothetical protein
MITQHTVTTALVAVLWMASVQGSSTQLLPASGQSPQGAIRILPVEVSDHIISLPSFIHSAVPELSRVGVEVVVAPTGAVVSAMPVSGNPQWYEKAAALAMTWRFTPFEREGNAIYATFSYVVRIVPLEKRPEQHISFPEIKDWNSVRITLQRTACRGLCPAYKLTIFGDGRVLFSGYTADYGGEYRGRVSPQVVHQLVDLFRSADYFNLFDRYGNVFDTSKFITSISFDGNSKSVIDDLGVRHGMPEIVSSLEDEIDRLAGSRVWAKEAKAHRQRW